MEFRCGENNHMGFPDSSVDKESSCNAGDPGSIPGSGRSTGEGIGYPLQYFWASLVVQLVENSPAMWETWVQSLGWQDPLEKGKSTPLQYSGLENSMDYMVHGVLKSDTTGPLSLSGHFTFDRHLYLKVLSEENKGVIHSNSI